MKYILLEEYKNKLRSTWGLVGWLVIERHASLHPFSIAECVRMRCRHIFGFSFSLFAVRCVGIFIFGYFWHLDIFMGSFFDWDKDSISEWWWPQCVSIFWLLVHIWYAHSICSVDHTSHASTHTQFWHSFNLCYYGRCLFYGCVSDRSLWRMRWWNSIYQWAILPINIISCSCCVCVCV